MLRAADIDPHAFRVLYDRYAEAVYCFFDRRVSQHQVSLDLTAETFAQAWLSRRRFGDNRRGSAGPWLYGIARNLLRHWIRHSLVEASACQRLGLLLRVDDVRVADDPSERDANGLERALAGLPSGQVAAVTARVIDGLTYEEVAEQLEITPTAARIRVSRGLAALRANSKEH